MNRVYEFLQILVVTILLTTACTEKNPVLTIEGGCIQGVPTGTPGVTVYRGIPFAAPPVGELRWKEPQPVVPWDGVKVADTWGNPAWQAAHTPGGYTPEFFFDGDPAFSEDCLYLNIWTPAAGKPSKKLPVTLWIHGGGYSAGWGFEPEMDGEEWARHGGVLVTFNYRLGLLGFLSHPVLSAESERGVSGNYGMLDQIAALKWVRANIAQFGGDPDHITLMGQSAGAMSVQTLVTSPLSKDLVAGAIIQSGGGITDGPLLGGTQLAEAEVSGQELMEWAGYETLEQMRAASPEELLAIPMRYMMEKKQYLRLSPVVDGYAYPETFQEAALAGRIANVPYMMGCTLDDMGMLASGIDRFCFEREKAGIPAYAYQFARRLPTDGREGVLQGAFHSSELWYMFKSLRFCWRPFISGDYDLAEQMITFWTNFAATGNPNATGPEIWTPCTSSSPEFMILKLDDDGQVASEMGACGQ
ncbi:MAG: carboxylesterase family protein [Bacteroidales bacterium]|nr:carboxylesterase family protein [Bacteroidales bacterium]